MREQVNEIVNNYIEWILQHVVNVVNHFLSVGAISDFRVRNFYVLLTSDNKVAEKIMLVQIFPSFLFIIQPIVRKLLFNFKRSHAGENCIATVLRTCRK